MTQEQEDLIVAVIAENHRLIAACDLLHHRCIRYEEQEQELLEALEECADELTAWISDRYPEDNLKFPSIQKDFELDMTVVEKARAVIAKVTHE